MSERRLPIVVVAVLVAASFVQLWHNSLVAERFEIVEQRLLYLEQMAEWASSVRSEFEARIGRLECPSGLYLFLAYSREQIEEIRDILSEEDFRLIEPLTEVPQCAEEGGEGWRGPHDHH